MRQLYRRTADGELNGKVEPGVLVPRPAQYSMWEQQRGYTPPAWHGSLIEDKRESLVGLTYRRSRYYDPTSGRFTQEDPIGLAGGLNLYGFANGDPVNFSDPFGLCKVSVRYSKVAVGYHAFITTEPTDATSVTPSQGFRGGPSQGASGGNVSGASSGASSRSSGSNSNSGNSSSPGSGAGGKGQTSGPWGPITTNSGNYDAGFIDYPGAGEQQPSQVAVNDDKDCAEYNKSFSGTLGAIEDAAIPYNPLTTNSNATVGTMLRRAGIRIRPVARAIGFDQTLVP